MSLLTLVVEHALDEGYAEAAERRPAGASQRPGWILAIGLIAVGLLLATAAVQAHRRAPSAAAARAQLTSEIARRTTATDRLQTRVRRLQASVVTARREALGLTSAGTRVSVQLSALEVATGAVAVTGPGLVVHLEDAAAVDQGAAGIDPRAGNDTGDARVTDRDLQTVVNEVWAAGAEAVAVNGQRLTALSAIRSAGQAVLVDFRPLSPPYDVAAIGPSAQLQSGFAEGLGGSYLQVLDNYGISSSVQTRKSLTLPAASGLPVRYASVPRPTGAPS